MKKKMLITVISLSIFIGLNTAQGSATVTGDISNVIVYRGQALVTRTIEADLPAGTSELVVSKLPSQIVSESLYSQTEGDVTVLSVRYREKSVREDTREEVKKLDDQIKEVTEKHRQTKRYLDYLRWLWRKYEAQWTFTVDAKNVDLNRSILQDEPLHNIVTHLEGRADQIHTDIVEHEHQINILQEELDLLDRKRKKLAIGNSRTEREAVIYLKKNDNRPVKLELSYLVNNADWSPQYNLRALQDKSIALIEYNAVIHQSSGEDWKNTDLALSTAEPTLIASPPVLEPMEITLTEEVSRYGRRVSSSTSGPVNSISAEMPAQTQQADFKYTDMTQEFESLVQLRKDNFAQGKLAQKRLNEIATSNQMIEFNATKELLQRIQKKMAVIKRTEGVSVMYKLDGKLSLPSRSDQQLVTIATIDAKTDYTLVATPLLTDYVYLRGEILNNSDTILLPGPASMYRNGEFVGKADMELVTIGQKFITGFGIDSQIQVVRKFKDKKVDTLWGNRVDTQQYNIEISNYKNSSVSLQLLERLPFTENPNVEITLLEPSVPLSKDTEYLRTQRDKGILRWDLELKPNTSGANAAVVKYGYTLKYDNDMTIKTVRANQ